MHSVPCQGRALAFTAVLATALVAQDSRPQRDHDHDHPRSQPDLATLPAGSATVRLVEIGLDTRVAVGASTERDESLAVHKGGSHDPRKRGFTLQNVELSLIGAVDPYADLVAHVVYALDPLTGETVLELEEAYATTQSLPAGFQLKAGHYLTDFGRINTQHPHAWDWLDQPVIATRLLGADGLRAPGARLAWRRGPLELLAGVQNAGGETVHSFFGEAGELGERPIGGRSFAAGDVRSPADLLWSARAAAACERGATALAAGASLAFGPNASGPDGDTLLWGLDLRLHWQRDRAHDAPFVTWQTEFQARAWRADGQVDANDPSNPGDDVLVPGDTLRDAGVYSQVTWGFAPAWAAGLRGEWAGGHGANYDPGADVFTGRAADPFRNERFRVSPLLSWRPAEAVRVRLQYDFDDAASLRGGDAHSVTLGVELRIGSHKH